MTDAEINDKKKLLLAEVFSISISLRSFLHLFKTFPEVRNGFRIMTNKRLLIIKQQ